MSPTSDRLRGRLLAVPGLLLALGLATSTTVVPGGLAGAQHRPAADATPVPVPTRRPVVAASTAGPRLGSRRAVPRPEEGRADDLTLSRARPILDADRVYDPPLIRQVVAEPPASIPETQAIGKMPVAMGPRLSIPGLGIERAIEEFPCDRAAPPDDHVFRWGCAGSNNLYLLGHAASVFRPLHDAYIAKRLAVGMTATWTDASGHSQTYHVTTWRLVRPDDASWAIADQAVPSMTLQTCVGAHSEYRLLVRLVA